jgi:hypothetical protein
MRWRRVVVEVAAVVVVVLLPPPPLPPLPGGTTIPLEVAREVAAAVAEEMSMSLTAGNALYESLDTPAVSLRGDTPYWVICRVAPGNAARRAATVLALMDTDGGGWEVIRESGTVEEEEVLGGMQGFKGGLMVTLVVVVVVEAEAAAAAAAAVEEEVEMASTAAEVVNPGPQ